MTPLAVPLLDADEGNDDANEEGSPGNHEGDPVKPTATTTTGSLQAPPLTTTLDDQLRLLAAGATVHDCPHCECCSGSLLVV